MEKKGQIKERRGELKEPGEGAAPEEGRKT